MNCPHCHKEFIPTAYGLIDCPFCGKPVFNRQPADEVVADEEPSLVKNVEETEALAANAITETSPSLSAIEISTTSGAPASARRSGP